MLRKRDIELIILEVLDCQDDNDKKSIKFLKENDETFNWNELAKYQNLSATLPTLLQTDIVPVRSRELLVKKLNRLIFGKEDIRQTKIFASGKLDADIEISEIEVEQNKIDWESLSVSDAKSKRLKGFEEVKTKTSSLKNESKQLYKIEETVEENDLSKYNNFSVSNKEGKKPSQLRKLVLVSVILFVVILGISAYMIFNNDNEVIQTAEEKQPVDTLIANFEEPVDNSVSVVQPILQPTEIQKVIVLDKPQHEKSVLPKAPPKLPDPIEAPLITTEEVVSKDESKIEEEISAPPPKEIVEETEEPVFFVAVEEMPQPIGGLQGIQKLIKYPEIAKRVGVEGKVFVRAFVDENGNVVNAEIVKGIGGGCDEAALEALLKTKFIPGKQRGKPIKVQVTLPVLFKL
jgi:periplasmic protein TonB